MHHANLESRLEVLKDVEDGVDRGVLVPRSARWGGGRGGGFSWLIFCRRGSFRELV